MLLLGQVTPAYMSVTLYTLQQLAAQVRVTVLTMTVVTEQPSKGAMLGLYASEAAAGNAMTIPEELAAAGIAAGTAKTMEAVAALVTRRLHADVTATRMVGDVMDVGLETATTPLLAAATARTVTVAVQGAQEQAGACLRMSPHEIATTHALAAMGGGARVGTVAPIAIGLRLIRLADRTAERVHPTQRIARRSSNRANREAHRLQTGVTCVRLPSRCPQMLQLLQLAHRRCLTQRRPLY